MENKFEKYIDDIAILVSEMNEEHGTHVYIEFYAPRAKDFEMIKETLVASKVRNGERETLVYMTPVDSVSIRNHV